MGITKTARANSRIPTGRYWSGESSGERSPSRETVVIIKNAFELKRRGRKATAEKFTVKHGRPQPSNPEG